MTSKRGVHDPRNLIYGGFAAMLFLVLLLGGTGHYFLRSVYSRLETIVSVNQAKTEAAYRMYNLMFMRSLSMNSLLSLEDAFERDQEYLRFHEIGTQFVAAREHFESLSLGAVEREIFDEALRHIRELRDLQERIGELAFTDRLDDARRLTARFDIPLRLNVSQHFSMLVAEQKRASLEARDAARHNHVLAISLLAIITVATLAAGGVIALYVRRRIGTVQDQLFAEKERAEVTLHAIGDAVITTDAEGRVEYLNPVAERLTGTRLAHVRGLPLGDIYRPLTRETGIPLSVVGTAPLAGPTCLPSRDIQLVAADGIRYDIEDQISPLHAQDGSVIGTLVAIRDVTEAKKLSRALDWAATHDPLTALVNRAEFERRLARVLNGGRRSEQGNSLMFLDLDRFKQVNDEAGHAAGDELLRRITDLMTRKVRDTDTLARLGGDEFAAILVGCPLERAERIAEELRSTVETLRFMYSGRLFSIGVSIGVIPLTEDVKNLETCLANADAACYDAKRGGRNRVVVYRD